MTQVHFTLKQEEIQNLIDESVEQSEFLNSKGNASEYLRELIDREMRKANGLEDEYSHENILDVINYKTAIITVMLNQLMKSYPELDRKSWSEKNVSFEQNWSKTFREASGHYRTLFEK